jgi:glycosyltransferase involved in cell wall biosynthesis
VRVAIVHDWLYVAGGAERVLREILRCYPSADVFTLFDILDAKDREFIGFSEARTSFIQQLPLLHKMHRLYLPLMPLAIEQFDFSEYDLVISSSYAVAKGVITGPNQLHVAYIHSPMRYAWDLQHTYLRELGYSKGLKSVAARMLLHFMRLWDVRTAHGPDVVVANSQFVARRIKKIYGRTAQIIHPPVELAKEPMARGRRNHFLAASRLVPYKNIEAIVRAFEELPDLELIVSGDGPEAARLKEMAGPNVAFAGFVSNERLRELMATARAFIFAAEEDFGIVVLEASSEGLPVLALGRGGALETVREGPDHGTGMFFSSPDPQEIARCVRSFVQREASFSPEACRAQAARFSSDRFRSELTALIESAYRKHIQRHQPSGALSASELRA